MVAREVSLLIEAHGAQGGAHRPFTRGENRTCYEHLYVLEDSFGEQWREGGQNPYHRSR